jgi:holo-[acyl-carrier protein] synthase
MILGVGTDLVSIPRIRRLRDRFPLAFPQRLLTPVEQKIYEQTLEKGGKGDHFLAKKFAAKEACLKALGTGMIQGISWHDMEITSLKSGQPYLRWSGGCLKILQEKAPGNQIDSHISIADEKDVALAFVVISIGER